MHSSHSIFVSLDSKKLRFSDMGFLDEFDGRHMLDVYSLGTPVFRVTFDDYICIGTGCIDKKEFVESYIAKDLYPDVLGDVLSRKRLSIKSDIVGDDVSFVQRACVDGKYDIEYNVTQKETIFVEKNGGFKLIIRFLD